MNFLLDRKSGHRFIHRVLASLFVTLIFSAPLYTNLQVSAHELTREHWFTINNDYPIIYNPIPQSTTLEIESAEKVINLTLAPGDELSFKVDHAVIEDELGLKQDQMQYTWEFSDRDPIISDDFQISFSKPGNYFLIIRVTRTDIDQTIFVDSNMLIVGERPAAPVILFNGVATEADAETASRTFRIIRTGNMQFAVSRPDTSRFRYEWDLADGQYFTGTDTTKQFANTRLPANIILRQTDLETGLFSENYITLVSDDDPEFQVVRPPVNEDIPERFDSGAQISVFTILIVILVAALIGLGFINRRRFRELATELKTRHLNKKQYLQEKANSGS